MATPAQEIQGKQIKLSTGKVINHRLMANGAAEAFPEMTDPEWEEYCHIRKHIARGGIHSGYIA